MDEESHDSFSYKGSVARTSFKSSFRKKRIKKVKSALNMFKLDINEVDDDHFK